MAIALAILIELITLACAGGVMFAGSMRTAGLETGDRGAARLILICGTIIAALVAVSHWVGW